MKQIILFTILLSFVSCGKTKGGDNSGNRETSPLVSELTEEEGKLISKLLEKRSLSDKVILAELLKLDQLEEGTLEKLDKHLHVICENGLCEITTKVN